MKKELLTLLRTADAPVSGQELSTQLGVSRTAVWKQINTLKEEGYEIEVSRRGYRLVDLPDVVTAGAVESLLADTRLGHPVRYYESITSTNQYAAALAQEGAPEGLLVTADEQTAGRGRSGRVWTTPPGSTVMMTLLLRPSVSPERVSMVTLLMGIAVAEACRELYGVDAGIKWPNDVVIGGRKVCGILTEMNLDCEIPRVSHIVIGVGINVNVSSFPEELSGKATSILIEKCAARAPRSHAHHAPRAKEKDGQEFRRAELIAEVIRRFEQVYDIFLQTEDLSALKDRYEALLVNRGRAVCVLEPKQSWTGVAEGINESGQLLVRREDGTLSPVYAGEVSVRGVYGYV